MDIRYMDRRNGKLIKETVAGGGLLRWSYENKIGRSLLEVFLKRRVFSRMVGLYMDTAFSRRRIPSYIKELEIDIEEALLERVEDYKSFNEFFIRRLRDGARPMNNMDEVLISPADGRVLAYEDIDINQVVQVKGFHYSLKELVGDESLAREYQGGSCIIVRLNPSDYHRFHFPDAGIPMEAKKIEGHYYSVNPLALSKIARLYCQNKREITLFKSQNFDDILLIEVGATCVGSIIQTYKGNDMVKKGEEKGYFKFGGSTTILFLKKDVVKIDKDLIENTEKGYETKILMGEGIAKKKQKN
ncbi:phosphatidylserine decarboxylase [Alkaliphilus serpentinus]|uniref:phosphatidylserine decarboxylase n=1 Tax=Alkaliphilus serpentinus TaxID=1482731 RepID=UPI002ED63799